MAKRKRNTETAQATAEAMPAKTEKKRVILTAPAAEQKSEARITFRKSKGLTEKSRDQRGELHMFEKELKSARDFWNKQYAFKDKNRGVDWDTFEKEAQILADEYNEHGFGADRDYNRDWADRRKKLHQWRERLIDAVIEDMAAKIQRMINAGNLHPKHIAAFEDQINDAKGERAIGVMSGIIRQLDNQSFDPEEEQVRGGRQQGGRRRR